MKYLTLILVALLTTACLPPEAHTEPVNMLAVLQESTVEYLLHGHLDDCEQGHNPDHLECRLPGGRVVAISWQTVTEDRATGEVYQVIAEGTLYKPWFRVECDRNGCMDKAWVR